MNPIQKFFARRKLAEMGFDSKTAQDALFIVAEKDGEDLFEVAAKIREQLEKDPIGKALHKVVRAFDKGDMEEVRRATLEIERTIERLIEQNGPAIEMDVRLKLANMGFTTTRSQDAVLRLAAEHGVNPFEAAQAILEHAHKDADPEQCAQCPVNDVCPDSKARSND